MRRAVLSSFLGAFFSLSLISVSAMAQATPEPELAEESTAQDPDEVFVISEVEINGLGRTKEFVVRFRGPAHTTANLEFRIPSLDTSWLVLQHVGFVDVTSVGQGASDFTDITAASAGAGIRLISPRIYRLTLRLDYAASLVNSGDSAISFGVQQFF